jgi:histidyl-tRNA synthetase
MADRELAKLFYVTNVFNFEETGKETREKWQCGAELIGAGSTMADVELMALALEVLRKLGCQGIELRLSHANLIRAVLEKLGLSDTEQTKLFDQILDGDSETLFRVKQEKPELGSVLAPLLDLKGKSAGFLKNMKALINQDLPELEPSLKNFIETAELLSALGVDYRIDITSGRGFEYYTGIIFQLFANGEHVGGGGRYDALIPSMGGRDTPASGFALYLDRLMNLVKPPAQTEARAQKVLIKTEPAPDIVRKAFALASRIRQAGYKAELYLGGKVPEDPGWKLDLQKDGPPFILIDYKNERYECSSEDKVLELLEKESAAKDSPA